MGSYTNFITKELKLKSETPESVIKLIDSKVNKQFDFEEKLPDHIFFTLERWDGMFDTYYWCKEKPYFKHDGKNWKLKIAVDINYGYQEIHEFAKWITPYVIGHKPKEFIGEAFGEERTKYNIYLERIKP
jgi:hypothetical protein